MRAAFRAVFCSIILFAMLCSSESLICAAERPEYKRTVHDYVMPDVSLINQDGKAVALKSLTSEGRIVILDFIFGTCTTICPVLSASFADFQTRFGAGAGSVQLVSISIDPEHDTPKILKEYLKKFKAKPGWDFFTGSRENIDRVMKAFDAFSADKMAHFPLTFVYSPAQKRWFRVSGLVSTSELMSEYQRALAQ